jgi:hypothetical protein
MSPYLSQALNSLKMASIEDGAIPGEAMTTPEIFVTFVAIPLVLFLGISLLAYLASGSRKAKTDSAESVVTFIE